ncbi:MAG: flavin reductase family protein [Muribaculaceae bacterium]|nr:flavin reductase family protein [Muribaculaceae bacterium]
MSKPLNKKRSWKPGTMIYPLPAVLVTCGASIEESNMLTVAWVGTVNTDPAMCYISVRPERHSYGLIKEQMEFTINLTTDDIARQTDWAGVRSGKEYDKWKETGLTPAPGVTVNCPYIDESPLSIECKVTSILPLGSHHMFLAKVTNVLADERFIEPESDRFDLGKAGLLNYTHGHYYSQGEELGRFGFSVKKNKKS